MAPPVKKVVGRATLFVPVVVERACVTVPSAAKIRAPPLVVEAVAAELAVAPASVIRVGVLVKAAVRPKNPDLFVVNKALRRQTRLVARAMPPAPALVPNTRRCAVVGAGAAVNKRAARLAPLVGAF